MRHFKDIDTIRSATAEELEQVPQMNRKAAESVYLFFHKPEKIQEDNAQLVPETKIHDNNLKMC